MNNLFTERLARQGTIIVAVGVLSIIAILIVPLPTPIIDIFIIFNIAFSLLLIVSTMYIHKPLDIASFPSILLLTTLLRLGLNVAVTRSILLKADGGKVIYAFGNFVVGGNYIVGVVIFIIIIIIQFIVITQGATRIAEVAARFTLDGMPGKQMAIDADLNTGLITEAEAKDRRLEIRRETDFYGAMDGASKFIRGDAVAGLLITAINIIGGLCIGVFQRHMPAQSALSIYTILTIGDGLVAQIPAIIIATASGILVTRMASESDLGRDIISQMLVNSKVLFIVSGALFVCAIVPGFPFFPFFLLSALIGGIGYLIKRSTSADAPIKPTPSTGGAEEVEDWNKTLRIDPIEIELGYGNIDLVNKEKGGDLLDRVGLLRKRIASELGFVVPPVRIRDNLELQPEEYVIKVKGTEIAKGKVFLQGLLAMNPGSAKQKLDEDETTEPVFNLPAYWITRKERNRAEALGYTIVEPSVVVTTHLQETIKSYANELLGRQETQVIIDRAKETHPAVVNELIPNIMKIGDIQKVLQNLLAERISIRDTVTILEALADYAPVTKDIDQLTEFTRQALKRNISQQYKDANGKINCVSIEPRFEQLILDSIEKNHTDSGFSIEPKLAQSLFIEISKWIEKLALQNYQPIIISSPRLRNYLRKLITPIFPNLVVLSFSELDSRIPINSLGEIKSALSGEVTA
ncbi:MAG: flagellar biosynthesis protein FlhA [bacterium]